MKKNIFLGLLILLTQIVPAQDTNEIGKRVKIKSNDGFEFFGNYYEGKDHMPSLFFIHMCGKGEKSDYYGLMKLLSVKGYSLLTFDLRGHGESRIDTYDSSKSNFWKDGGAVLMRKDVEAAYEYLKSVAKSNKSVGIIGASCGAWYASVLASNNKNVEALVFISGGIGEKEKDYIVTNNIPVLGIASMDDEDGEMVRKVGSIISVSKNNNTSSIFLNNGGHGTKIFKNHKRILYKISEWLNNSLKVR